MAESYRCLPSAFPFICHPATSPLISCCVFGGPFWGKQTEMFSTANESAFAIYECWLRWLRVQCLHRGHYQIGSCWIVQIHNWYNFDTIQFDVSRTQPANRPHQTNHFSPVTILIKRISFNKFNFDSSRSPKAARQINECVARAASSCLTVSPVNRATI